MAAADTIRFICPGCGYRARIPASFTGKVILCPGCQQVQIASSDHGEPSGDTVSVSRVATASARELTAAQVSVPDASGKIRFTCAKCGFHAKLASSYAGKAIACPGCQAPQLIPPLGSAPLAATAAAAAAAAGPAADRPSTTPTVAAPVLSDEPGISFDEPMASGPAPAERSAPQAAPAKPAPKPAAPSRPPQPSPPSSRSLGVVRRGAREASPDRDGPAGADEDDGPEVATAPKAPSANALAPVIQRFKEPRFLGIAIACVVALILEVCLIVSWRGAVAEADKYRASSKQAEDQLKDAKSALSHTEYDRDELTSKLKTASDQLKKIQDDLAMAQKAAQDAGEKYKAAEAERQKEYDERKQAVAQYDDAFAKLKKSELAREEDYKRRLEAEKARDEEARLRKELKGKLDELAKTPK